MNIKIIMDYDYEGKPTKATETRNIQQDIINGDVYIEATRMLGRTLEQQEGSSVTAKGRPNLAGSRTS